MNVVLDTNVLLVSLPGHSPFHPIYQGLRQHKFDTFVTNEILTEYEEQISIRLGVARTEIQIRELLNLPGIHQIDVYYRWQLITADPDDRSDGPQ
jgi:predicted nucleic acid-binding protein